MLPLHHKVEQALARDGLNTTDDLIDAIKSHRAFPFFRNESVVIADIRKGLAHHEVNCWVMAGDMDDCMHLLGEVEDWARTIGATHVRGETRLGFQRVLKDKGYGVHAVIMRKSVVAEGNGNGQG